MPVLQSDTVVSAIGSPLKKSRLSLKFFQKKETKRALDFSESQVEEQTPFEPDKSCDQVVPAPPPPSPTCERKDNVVPFVGLNNLGNTCYLNSILQVLYYCPGFKDAIKKLYSVLSSKEKQKDDTAKKQEGSEEVVPMNMELLESFHSLIISMELLQSSFLLNCKEYNDGELATPPRRLLNTLRNLNPMYEGYLQHDAQEVLRCILGYIQEACESIKNEFKSDVQLDITEGKYEREEDTDSSDASSGTTKAALKNSEDDKDRLEGQVTGKRKSDTEAGNAKKRSKPLKTKKPDESKHFTRSKRKSSSDVSVESGKDENKGGSDPEETNHDVSKVPTKSQKRPRLSWLKPSGKQPSIFSKFRSMGRISSQIGGKEDRAEQEKGGLLPSGKDEDAREIDSKNKLLLKSEEKKEPNEGNYSFDLMERMFQGRLVLRTRCLECECFTERREDFQDISVPVQEDEPCQDDQNSEISPDPKPELKTLKWAISQFASVERIVGEDKYFCETCHHYTEAERSLLFDKTPEVVTIHLKCFAANSSEIDPYAGLSKVNTPLQTPLRLSLDEWCTWPSKEHYELFAVVMHSGVTISSGHYTTYVKMMDLKNVKVELAEKESFTSEPLNEKAKAYGPRDYDDGEVSFSLSGKVQTSTAGSLAAKKASEGVGLLGGQRSVCSIELAGNKQANSDKAAGAATERAKARPINSSHGHQSIVKNEECGEPLVTACEDGDKVSVGVESAQRNLLDYEGKWMLFDDSEVRLFEEKDFLKACSPETCTTSTPYLLFYKKVQV